MVNSLEEDSPSSFGRMLCLYKYSLAVLRTFSSEEEGKEARPGDLGYPDPWSLCRHEPSNLGSYLTLKLVCCFIV